MFVDTFSIQTTAWNGARVVSPIYSFFQKKISREGAGNQQYCGSWELNAERQLIVTKISRARSALKDLQVKMQVLGQTWTNSSPLSFCLQCLALMSNYWTHYGLWFKRVAHRCIREMHYAPEIQYLLNINI